MSLKSGKRIMIVASLSDSLINFRGNLIQTLVESNNQVLCCAAEIDPLSGSHADASLELKGLGAEWRSFPLARTGMNPIKDLASLHCLRKIVKDFQPDILLSYTVKPNIYGSIAARSVSKTKAFSLITGLTGGLRTESEIHSKKGRLIVKMYQNALKSNSGVIFQNPDDLELFKYLSITANCPTTIVNGSGVDMSYFASSSVPLEPVRFLCVARLLAEKGIREFANAAREVKKEYPKVEFDLVGPYDPQPSSITPQEVKQWEGEGILNYHGAQPDVRPFLAKASVFVLPSYREGTPRSVLEALATGRPIITSDAPGCRQTVIQGKNGFLIQIGNAEELALTMKQLIQSPALMLHMAEESLKFCAKFEVQSVSNSIIDFMFSDL